MGSPPRSPSSAARERALRQHHLSTFGLKIVPSQGVYAATKNAVRTITEALRQEVDATLRITGISPGFHGPTCPSQ